MYIQRTITIGLPDDPDLRATVDAFGRVQQTLSPIAFNGGQPLGYFALYHATAKQVKGTISAQMTTSAMRAVVGAYAAAKRNKHPVRRPFGFARRRAIFYVGKRGRDADFRTDGTLSIWTVAGRKHLPYTIPAAFKDRFAQAIEIDSLNVIEQDGRLIGRVTLTLEVPEPQGSIPVGIDLNETNALVAVDTDGRVLFISGRDAKVRNVRTSKTRKRVQNKLAVRKADGRDTHAVRRLLKRLGRKRSQRTCTFARQTARQLVDWAPAGAVLVFEDLTRIRGPARGMVAGVALRRRLTLWQRRAIRQAVEGAAAYRGILVAEVDPRYTSQTCSRCGLRGDRKRHVFSCLHCGHAAHSDINAAMNIRTRYAVSR